jgi:hypothetical protein
MSFNMTHLIVSDEVSKIFAKNILDLPQFFLGNLAPDAVHQREGYIPDFKKHSHLCVGDERWGMITNNDEWKESIVNFLFSIKRTENHDFILGYCCHLITDVLSNVALWIPFKQKYPKETWHNSGYGNLFHQETNMVDIELTISWHKKNFYWITLEKSKGVDLDGLVFAEEVSRHKDIILNDWYTGKERQDIKTNKLVTCELTMDFIKNATNSVVQVFRTYFAA